MKSFLKKLGRNEKGNALLIAGAGLPLLLGFAGLANDTIQWSLWKRQLQRQADSAAIAGVYARFAGQNLTTAVTRDLAKNSRTGIAFATGYPQINTPPDGADWTKPVQVGLAVRRELPFSQFFMSAAPLIEVSATAGGIEVGEYCGRAQVDTAETGISAGGNVEVKLNCALITNSLSMEAAVAFGSSKVQATAVAAVGGLDSTDNWSVGTKLMPFTMAQQDPFADIEPPAVPTGCTKYSDQPKSVTTLSPTKSNGTPNCFTDFDVKGTLTLNPGTYIITGDMKINSGAEISCTGCTFVLTDNPASGTGSVDISGGAQLNLSAPDTGTYRGILFYQNRGASTTLTNKINGNSKSSLRGAFYFPHSKVEYTGNAGLTFDCIKLVSWQLTFLGNASIENKCPAGWYGDRFMGRHVRLVG